MGDLHLQLAPSGPAGRRGLPDLGVGRYPKWPRRRQGDCHGSANDRLGQAMARHPHESSRGPDRSAGPACRSNRIRAAHRDVLHRLRESGTAINGECVEMQTKDLAAAFSGFSKLGRDQRLKALLDMGALERGDIDYLRSGGLKDISFANTFIENAIGYLEMPLGIATNFRIDGKDYVVPMAVEETSIIAAASKTARWVRDCGSITTEARGAHIIGQIQCARIDNWFRFQSRLFEHKGHLIALANEEAAASLVSRGGGVNDLEVRAVPRPDGGTMGVIHILLDARDAM